MLLFIFVQSPIYWCGGNDIVVGARGQGFDFPTGQMVNIMEQNSVLVIVLPSMNRLTKTEDVD